MAIEHVLLVGGTHGNELTGIYLIKQFERFPETVRRSSFKTSLLLANPRAFELGIRYVDADLNRQFRLQDVVDPTLSSYEARRAKAIYQQFGSQGNQPIDVIVDLHSSTANMGLTIILSNHCAFNLELAIYLRSIFSDIKILYSDIPTDDNPFLESISKYGCKIEVGAISHNVLDAALFQQTAGLVQATLNYVELYNQSLSSTSKRIVSSAEPLLVYQRIGNVDYPRDVGGEIQAMIHPHLQSRDYQPLHPGDPMFLTFAGETILYAGDVTVYPVFINEAAYYEKGIAMCFTEQVSLETSQ
jgi:aspartoacylase